ncbi:hypothetical protein GJ496_005039 [Pomphorhynchus laevis]|nr:hypothetical protein GJ496_005039 [Pomphorhynchus laevis]
MEAISNPFQCNEQSSKCLLSSPSFVVDAQFEQLQLCIKQLHCSEKQCALVSTLHKILVDVPAQHTRFFNYAATHLFNSPGVKLVKSDNTVIDYLKCLTIIAQRLNALEFKSYQQRIENLTLELVSNICNSHTFHWFCDFFQQIVEKINFNEGTCLEIERSISKYLRSRYSKCRNDAVTSLCTLMFHSTLPVIFDICLTLKATSINDQSEKVRITLANYLANWMLKDEDQSGGLPYVLNLFLYLLSDQSVVVQREVRQLWWKVGINHSERHKANNGKEQYACDSVFSGSINVGNSELVKQCSSYQIDMLKRNTAYCNSDIVNDLRLLATLTVHCNDKLVDKQIEIVNLLVSAFAEQSSLTCAEQACKCLLDFLPGEQLISNCLQLMKINENSNPHKLCSFLRTLNSLVYQAIDLKASLHNLLLVNLFDWLTNKTTENTMCESMAPQIIQLACFLPEDDTSINDNLFWLIWTHSCIHNMKPYCKRAFDLIFKRLLSSSDNSINSILSKIIDRCRLHYLNSSNTIQNKREVNFVVSILELCSPYFHQITVDQNVTVDQTFVKDKERDNEYTSSIENIIDFIEIILNHPVENHYGQAMSLNQLLLCLLNLHEFGYSIMSARFSKLTYQLIIKPLLFGTELIAGNTKASHVCRRAAITVLNEIFKVQDCAIYFSKDESNLINSSLCSLLSNITFEQEQDTLSISACINVLTTVYRSQLVQAPTSEQALCIYESFENCLNELRPIGLDLIEQLLCILYIDRRSQATIYDIECKLIENQLDDKDALIRWKVFEILKKTRNPKEIRARILTLIGIMKRKFPFILLCYILGK